MSEHRLIACSNCGSKYRLPPSFQGQKARCKSCGATIEIAASIVSEGAETPRPADRPKAPEPKAAAKAPAKAARTSTGRSARGERGADKSSSRRGARAGTRAGAARGARGRGSDEDEDEGHAGRRGARGRGGRGRRGAEVDEAPNRTGLYVGGGIAVVAVALALFFLLGNNGDKGQGGTDNGQGQDMTAKAGGAAAQVAKPEEATAKTDQIAKPEEATAKTDQPAKPGEAGKEGDEGAGKKPDEAGKGDGKKPEEATAKTDEPAKPVHKGPGYMSTPFDAKTMIEPLPWAPDTSEEEKKEIAQLVHDAFYDDSIVGMRAQRSLLGEYSRKAYPAIVNVLREADYMDPEQNMQAYNFHTKVVMKILVGVNVPYNAGQTPGEKPVQEQAWWNAKCVESLAKVWAQLENGDKAKWDEFISKRKETQKKDDADEDF